MVSIAHLESVFSSNTNTDTKVKNAKEKTRKWKSIAVTVLFIMSSASFSQFIIEEAIQNYSFGVMSIVMNKDWDMLREELPKYQAFHDSCQKFMYITYCLNPLTGYYFQFFMDSNQAKIDIWKRQVNRHDSRFRIVVAGEVVDSHVNGDGTGVIVVDTGSVREYIVVPFPEVTPLPKKGELVRLECANKYIRGTKRLELVRMEK